MSEKEKEWEEFQEMVKKLNKPRDILGACTVTKTVGEMKIITRKKSGEVNGKRDVEPV